MHPSILAKRKAQALNRIMAKAEALVTRLELDPALIAALQPVGVRDPQVIEMIRLEALANLFDRLAVEAGITEPVTVVTEPGSAPEPARAEVTPPEAETLEGGDAGDIGVDLPAPVISEEMHVADDGGQAVPPGIEEVPVEVKASTSKKRKQPSSKKK